MCAQYSPHPYTNHITLSWIFLVLFVLVCSKNDAYVCTLVFVPEIFVTYYHIIIIYFLLFQILTQCYFLWHDGIWKINEEIGINSAAPDKWNSETWTYEKHAPLISGWPKMLLFNKIVDVFRDSLAPFIGSLLARFFMGPVLDLLNQNLLSDKSPHRFVYTLKSERHGFGSYWFT